MIPLIVRVLLVVELEDCGRVLYMVLVRDDVVEDELFLELLFSMVTGRLVFDVFLL